MATASLTSGVVDRNNTDHRYSAIIIEETLRAFWANNVTFKFLRKDSIEEKGGKTLQFNVQATNTAAAALTETQDLSNTQLDHTVVTLTAAEVGAMTTMSKWAQKNAVGQMRDIEYYGNQLAKSFSKKLDTDVTALFSALNSGTAAGSGSGDTDVIAALDTALMLLEENDAFSGYAFNPVGVLRPRTVHYLRQQIYNTANTIYGDFQSKKGIYADANGWVGEFMGIDLWATTNVYEISKAHRGAVFVPGKTFGLVEKYALNEFMDADPSLRATEIGITHAYGVGELEDTSGVSVSIDSNA